jgi:hypothetical protein
MSYFLLGVNVVMVVGIIGVLFVGFQVRDRLDKIAEILAKK